MNQQTVLEHIQESIQALLDAYTGVTSLKKVSLISEKSDEPSFKDFKDEQTLLIVYRELPSALPQLTVADGLISGSFNVHAPTNEKDCVYAIVSDFIISNNATRNFVVDGIFYFTNLTPTGARDNKGSTIYSVWSFGMTFRILSSLMSIYDREIRYNFTNNFSEYWTSTNKAYYDSLPSHMKIDGEIISAPEFPTESPALYPEGFCLRRPFATPTYYKIEVPYSYVRAEDGLLTAVLNMVNDYSTAPLDGGFEHTFKSRMATIQVNMVDNISTRAAAFKTIGYAMSSSAMYVMFVSGSSKKRFLAKLKLFNDTATSEGFPTFMLTFEGRVV